MVRRRIDEAAAAMEGSVIAGNPCAVWSGVCLDSRKVEGGELFFALPGARTDGHRFVDDAVDRGAAAAVIERAVEVPVGSTLIRVEETLAALHRLTSAVRLQVPRRLVAITGSIGKTTTKELLAAMLARRFRVARSPGNLNNLYGFPVALLGIPDDTELMVAEMGMSTAGELGRTSRLGRPDVAVFTNVRPVHLEFFADVRQITEAKAELLEGLDPAGIVVANADDPEVARIARRHRGRVVWFGRRQKVEVRASAAAPLAGGRPGSRFTLSAAGRSVEVRLPLHGLYNTDNCLASAACAWALGVTLEEIATAAEAVEPAEMRGVVHRLAGESRIIDDCYNSNPDALDRALESACRLPARRRWAVLGEMLELGPGGPGFHRAAGWRAARRGFSPVAGVGELARELAAAAAAEGVEARWFEDAAAAAHWAVGELRDGDLVLVKGSRGVGLEAVVQALLRGREGDA